MQFKKRLRPEQVMSSVEVAADYANRMIEREARGPGDTEEAMRRIRAAYLATCERQLHALQHELALEKARCGDDAFADLVDEAEALVARLKAARGKVGLPASGDT